MFMRENGNGHGCIDLVATSSKRSNYTIFENQKTNSSHQQVGRIIDRYNSQLYSAIIYS